MCVRCITGVNAWHVSTSEKERTKFVTVSSDMIATQDLLRIHGLSRLLVKGECMGKADLS